MACIGPLIDVLEANPTDPAVQRCALKALTGQDFGRDVAAWRKWAKHTQN